ncbi:MAG: hypothetical protein J5684_03590, partial [Eubacterium sp.]|nr:hypothetical protein [Eubacterium sp.]
IKDNGQGGKPEQDIRLEFPDLVTLTVHMIPPKTSSDVAIKKQIWHVSSQDVPQDTPDKYKNYIYRSRIRITSNGINSNVQFNDEMWPGMTLYSDPVFYSDLELTTEIDSSTFNLKYKKGQNTISAVIPSMSSDEQIWVSYLVLVDPAMFNMETAKEFLKTADPDNKYYYEGFKGKVSNKATAKSDEAPKEVRSWGDVGTIGGSIDKWSCPEDHQFSKGLMHWEIVIKSIIDTDYETGYIIDKLPKNMSLVEENTFIRDTATYNIFKNGIDIKQTKNDDGTTDVKFELSEEVMKFLKKKETSQAVITYDTKIERQEESEKRYENVATIYYNGDELMEVSAADTFKKPKDLSKVGPYERDKAPFIEFTVTANPAALDLDPNADELTLEDQLCDYYDLDVDSVKVNGKKPGSDIFTYSSSSRKFTLKLQDGVAYTITYRARVNLKKGEWLSGSNSATLYSDSTTGYKQSAKTEVESEVFQSAASSSSENETGVLNIVKHEKGNDSKLLEGAKFSLTTMDGISTVKKLSEDDKGVIETTGANGVAAYGDLERGVVYMLKEVEAPAQYKIDDTIRFYAFTDTKFSFGSTVTYEGTEYPLTVVPLERASYDVYMENEKIPEKSEGSIKITKTISGTVDDADRDSISFVVNDGTTDVWTGTLGTKFTPNSDGVYEAVIDKLDTGKTYSVTESMKDIDGTTLSVSYEINGGSTVEGKSATGVTVEKDKTTTVSFHNVFTKIIKKGSLKFIKTITGLDDNSLADGITFKIAKESEPGSPIATFTYADIKADGYKQIDDLDFGTYTVTESSTNITDYEFKNTSAQMTSSVEVKAENTADAPAELSLSNVYEKEEKPEEPIEEPVVEPVEVTISKVDITDGPEIEGAELVITKDTEDGQVIESWTSGKVSGETGPHKVKLSEGTYVLKETLVPDDFHLQAESITFTVGADGTVTVAGNVSDEKKVVMVDAPAGALRIVIEEEETGDKVPNAVVTVTTMKPEVYIFRIFR